MPPPVNELISSDHFRFSNPIEIQLAEGGIAFEDGNLAKKTYPHLWSSAAAASKSLGRAKSQTNPYKKFSVGECPTLRRVTYKQVGQGRRINSAYVDFRVVPNPRKYISRLVGPLADFDLEASIDRPSNVIWRSRRISDMPPNERARWQRFSNINYEYGKIVSGQRGVDQSISYASAYVMMNWLTDIINEGWNASDVFGQLGSGGLIRALRGRKIVIIDENQAVFDDGDSYARIHSTH